MTTPTGGINLQQRRDQQLDVLREAHARAHDIDLRSAEHLDRVVLIGGAAAIIASANHLHDLDGALRPASFVLITAGWLLLLLGGGCGIAAYLTARHAARCISRMLRRKIEAGEWIVDPCDYDTAEVPNRWTRRLNYAGLMSFVLGVLAVVAFAWINLPRN